MPAAILDVSVLVAAGSEERGSDGEFGFVEKLPVSPISAFSPLISTRD
jgi:hypothetical protein